MVTPAGADVALSPNQRKVVLLTLCLAAFTIIMSMTSTAGGGLVNQIGDKFMICVAAMAGVTLIAAIIGWVMGRKS